MSDLAESAATTVFSYIIFGQIVDNSAFESHRKLFCGIEIAMGVWFTIMGGVYVHDSKTIKCSETCEDSTVLQFSSFSFFLTSAFQIMITL